jgi:hypothetical protein
MLVEELIARLDSGQYNFDDEVGVEINGTVLDIVSVKSGPEGLTLVVDSFEEERALRQVTLEDLEGACDG